jgi:predicted aminopeptidase
VRRFAFWALMVGGSLAGAVLAAVLTVCLTSGCSTVGYYAQAVNGHLDLVQRARPVADWLADDATDESLRERLALSQRMRDFAIDELKLPDNRSYRRYADLGRSAVVWNVVAAPELSLELKTWCFAFTGCVGYRGTFREAPAQALGERLRAEGWEVMVYGVPAYSTLGKTDWLGGDPLLNTFIGWPEAELARLIFHELAHQVVYVGDDTTFNESFAVAVERIGVARWLQRHASAAAQAEYADIEARREDFRALTLRTREQLRVIFASDADQATQRAGKAETMAAMRAEYERIKVERWDGFAGYDGWMARANNASLAIQAAYDELVPDFERLFERLDGDFDAFYAEVRRLADLPRDERRATLAARP